MLFKRALMLLLAAELYVMYLGGLTMKLNCIILVCFTAFYNLNIFADDNSEDFKLVLDTDYQITNLRDPVELELIIKGKGVSEIVSSTKDIVPVKQQKKDFFVPSKAIAEEKDISKILSEIKIDREKLPPSSKPIIEKKIVSKIKTSSKNKVSLKQAKKDIFTSAEPKILDSFIYRFAIKPSKAGKLVVGPYEIEFQGKKLKSNTLELMLYDVPEDKRCALLKSTATRVKLGEPFSLVIEHNIKEIEDLDLKPSIKFKVTSTSSQWSSISKNGNPVKTFQKEYVITPLGKGLLKFGKNSFSGLQKGIYIPEVSVNID